MNIFLVFWLLPQSNIGLVLHGVMEYDLSLRFLENALTINTKYHGPRSLKVALRWGEIHHPYSYTGLKVAQEYKSLIAKTSCSSVYVAHSPLLIMYSKLA